MWPRGDGCRRTKGRKEGRNKDRKSERVRRGYCGRRADLEHAAVVGASEGERKLGCSGSKEALTALFYCGTSNQRGCKSATLSELARCVLNFFGFLSNSLDFSLRVIGLVRSGHQERDTLPSYLCTRSGGIPSAAGAFAHWVGV